MRARSLRSLSLLLAALALGPAPARAESRDSRSAEVERLANAGLAQYQAGDYLGAADTLLQAYELRPYPELLYNIARSYEKAGQSEAAIRYYQRFVDASHSDPKLVKQAVHALERLHAESDQKHAAEAAREHLEAEDQRRQREQAQRAASLAELRAEQAEQAAAARAAPPAPAPERPSKAPGLVLLGAGAVGLGVGLGTGLQARALTLAALATTSPQDKPALRDRAYDWALGSDVATGAGLALAGVGAALLVRALLAPEPQPAVAAPAAQPQVLLWPGGAGLGVRGAL